MNKAGRREVNWDGEASQHEVQAAVGGADGRRAKSRRTVEVPRIEAVVVLAASTSDPLHQPVELRPSSPHHALRRGTNSAEGMLLCCIPCCKEKVAAAEEEPGATAEERDREEERGNICTVRA